jgi:hypothetical protein
MKNTRTLVIAAAIAVAFAGQASAGGLLGLGILGNKGGGIVIAPNVGLGVGDILSNNKTNVLNGVLNGSLNNILNRAGVGILAGGGNDGGDNGDRGNCGCKKRRH